MFRIRYDYRVAGDVALLAKTVQKRIKKSIEEKLFTQPEVFGKPLRRSLLGFRSLRVGDYRVVYRIEGETNVFIVFIAHRKYVYKRAAMRHAPKKNENSR